MEGGSRTFAKYKRRYLCDASAKQIGDSATQVSLNGEGTIVQTTPINISTTHRLTPTEKVTEVNSSTLRITMMMMKGGGGGQVARIKCLFLRRVVSSLLPAGTALCCTF